MPRFRSRGDICKRCMSGISITANLDARIVTDARIPDACLDRNHCHERLSHDIFDQPFQNGEQRTWSHE